MNQHFEEKIQKIKWIWCSSIQTFSFPTPVVLWQHSLETHQGSLKETRVHTLIQHVGDASSYVLQSRAQCVCFHISGTSVMIVAIRASWLPGCSHIQYIFVLIFPSHKAPVAVSACVSACIASSWSRSTLLNSWSWHNVKWVCVWMMLNLKTVLRNDANGDEQTWKMSFRFLKYSFICEFTRISNTSKSNSIW